QSSLCQQTGQSTPRWSRSNDGDSFSPFGLRLVVRIQCDHAQMLAQNPTRSKPTGSALVIEMPFSICNGTASPLQCMANPATARPFQLAASSRGNTQLA